MDEMEYMVVNCLGTENVVKCLEEFTAEVPQWYLHSCITSGLQTHQHPLAAGMPAVAVMTFMVILERPHTPSGNIEA